MVNRKWLNVIGYWLLVKRYWLIGIGCWLSVWDLGFGSWILGFEIWNFEIGRDIHDLLTISYFPFFYFLLTNND